jgi:hypothetical protein
MISTYRGDHRAIPRQREDREPINTRENRSPRPEDDGLGERRKVDFLICADIGARTAVSGTRLLVAGRRGDWITSSRFGRIRTPVRDGGDRIRPLAQTSPGRAAHGKGRRRLRSGSPRCVRIARTVGSSVMKAVISTSPPQREHTRGNDGRCHPFNATRKGGTHLDHPQFSCYEVGSTQRAVLSWVRGNWVDGRLEV